MTKRVNPLSLRQRTSHENEVPIFTTIREGLDKMDWIDREVTRIKAEFGQQSAELAEAEGRYGKDHRSCEKFRRRLKTLTAYWPKLLEDKERTQAELDRMCEGLGFHSMSGEIT